MKLTISHKLILAFLGLTILVLVATLSLARWSFERGFLDYVNAVAQTELEWIRNDMAREYQSAQNSWATMTPKRFEELIHQSFQSRFSKDNPPPPHHISDRPPSEEQHGDRDRAGRKHRRKPPKPPIALFNSNDQLIAGTHLSGIDVNHIRVAIIVDNQKVGELRIEPRRRLTTSQETAFSRQQANASWVIGAVSLSVALVFSLLLARELVAPIRRMISNVAQLAQGNYSVRLHEKRTDEFGKLMNDLDRLGQTLNETQLSRQRWLAEISHELRTPVTVLTGELEALKDGLRNFDQDQLNSLDQEVERLRKLINDLYELSISDIGGLRYSMSEINIQECLVSAVESFKQQAHDKDIKLIVQSVDAVVFADRHRLDQLFKNLLLNSLNYTDAPGRIEVTMTCTVDRAVIEFHDTPPGVSKSECDQLFEPLYRKEESRNRRTGGAGLGLAICRKIAQAHNSSIFACPSHLGGLCIHIEIPLAMKTKA